MTRVLRYIDLTPDQREALFAFTALHDPERYPDFLSMERGYSSIAFEHGESQFSYWVDGVLRGAMGAVVREATVRGEVFITAVAVEPGYEAGFDLLLARCLALIPDLPDLTVRMGISPRHPHLETHVKRNGFELDYDGLIMAREPGTLALSADDQWCIETVVEANREAYRLVLDDAMRHSPNGASISEEQVLELMAEISHPDLLGLARLNGEPAAGYELCLQEDVGWIELVAVARPLQGQGLGKRMVASAMERLSRYQVSRIKLLVMSSNVNAVKLYERCGFTIESITSRWWRLARNA